MVNVNGTQRKRRVRGADTPPPFSTKKPCHKSLILNENTLIGDGGSKTFYGSKSCNKVVGKFKCGDVENSEISREISNNNIIAKIANYQNFFEVPTNNCHPDKCEFCENVRFYSNKGTTLDKYIKSLDLKVESSTNDINRLKSKLDNIHKGIKLLHETGYTHNDIKPENVIVIGETAKIIDFGNLRIINHTIEYHVGTVFYLWNSSNKMPVLKTTQDASTYFNGDLKERHKTLLENEKLAANDMFAFIKIYYEMFNNVQYNKPDFFYECKTFLLNNIQDSKDFGYDLQLLKTIFENYSKQANIIIKTDPINLDENLIYNMINKKLDPNRNAANKLKKSTQEVKNYNEFISKKLVKVMEFYYSDDDSKEIMILMRYIKTTGYKNVFKIDKDKYTVDCDNFKIKINEIDSYEELEKNHKINVLLNKSILPSDRESLKHKNPKIDKIDELRKELNQQAVKKEQEDTKREIRNRADQIAYDLTKNDALLKP